MTRTDEGAGRRTPRRGPAVNAGTMVRTRTASRRLASLAAALLLALGPIPSVTPAVASCAPPLPIEESLLLSDVVLVGTVTQLENGGRWVTVRVEERWRGPASLPGTVSVRGGPEPGAATSVDRVFARGRYLFFLTDGPGYFVDNACSATTPWTAELATLRPDGVPPAPEVVTDAPPSLLDQVDVLPVAALLGALAIAVASYIVILRARRRPPDWMR